MELKQKDINLLLKASVDFNSAMLALVAQVTGNKVKPNKVFSEIKKQAKLYEKNMEQIAKKYDVEM